MRSLRNLILAKADRQVLSLHALINLAPMHTYRAPTFHRDRHLTSDSTICMKGLKGLKGSTSLRKQHFMSMTKGCLHLQRRQTIAMYQHIICPPSKTQFLVLALKGGGTPLSPLYCKPLPLQYILRPVKRLRE